LENYNLTPDVFWDSGQCYYEVKDDESHFDKWFGTFSVWSLNFGNLHFSPWTLKKIQFGPYVVLDRIEDGLWVKFQYGYVFTVWSSFGKITFGSLFWIIVVLVSKPRRLNLVFFYALESFICVVLSCFWVYFVYLL
jgi:hypothetical protein